ncbi:uncharacterized protein LOC120573877 isoform X2 [Perca fluviatilis]|uniref:uncharacterized protein LOC120573877 isoform X2 n=1 Tax=Perca fluviatilis TaxID=8168 RepID=UPI00196464AE|nr:uncharacterized protein LOC120573877 isoform X2 [Perca fluviatilis]
MESFQTDYYKLFGRKSVRRPVMIICDGSLVLMQAVAYSFCKHSLESLLSVYYDIVTGQLKEVMNMPILHRCLSHIMKNAKVFCKKHSPKHYRLSMHLFGLLTSAATLMEMDDIITSMAVLFSSPQSGDNVEKHFQNLQNRLQTIGFSESSDRAENAENDFEINLGHTTFHTHFAEIVANAPVDVKGEPNEYHSPTFMPNLVKYFLPQAVLWSGLMLGDLGRHGKGPAYNHFSKIFMRCSQSGTQNYTEDNKTQAIMEKSQWDLKKIRFQRRRLTRLDDFVQIYQQTHNALLMEFSDSTRKRKTYRVNVERWRKRKPSKKGIYVSPIKKSFPFRTTKVVLKYHIKYYHTSLFLTILNNNIDTVYIILYNI